MSKIVVLGAGAYGIAFAKVLAKNQNNDVVVWTPFEQQYDLLCTTGKYMQDVAQAFSIKDLPIRIEKNIAVAADADFVVLAVPSAVSHQVLEQVQPYFSEDSVMVIASKGMNRDGGFIDETAEQILRTDRIATVSGGSFAYDVASGAPVGLTIASKHQQCISQVQNLLDKIDTLHLDTTQDIQGVEFLGVMKNIYAIVAGMIAVQHPYPSTTSLFLLGAIANLETLLEQIGSQRQTVHASAGLGDIILTCSSEMSRNYSFGEVLVGGDTSKIEEFLRTNTVEGAASVEPMKAFLAKKGLQDKAIEIICSSLKGQTTHDVLGAILARS